MKFMTFNTQHCLNFLEQKIDFEVMANAIKTVGADVVGLQEMRGSGENEEYADQTKILSELSGLPYYEFGKAIYFENLGPYGNSIISRYPIISSEIIPIPDPDPKTGNKYYETRAILKARLENGITVLVTHFGLNDDEQQNAVKTVVANLESEKCILMGDFNAEPHNSVLLPIREKMKDSSDFIKGNLLTFPSDKPYEKIDYIFVTPDIEIISAEIPEIIASDHRPHTVDIR